MKKGLNEWSLKIREEIKRVKNLKSNSSQWIVNNRPDKSIDGQIWEDNALWRIQEVDKVLIDRLKINSTTTVSYLHNLPVSRVTESVNSDISRKLLKEVITKSVRSISGAYNHQVINHCKRAISYKRHYPDDHLERVASLTAIKPFLCITELNLYTISE